MFIYNNFVTAVNQIYLNTEDHATRKPRFSVNTKEKLQTYCHQIPTPTQKCQQSSLGRIPIRLHPPKLYEALMKVLCDLIPECIEISASHQYWNKAYRITIKVISAMHGSASYRTWPRVWVEKVVKLTLQFNRPTSLYIIAFLLSLGPNLNNERWKQSLSYMTTNKISKIIKLTDELRLGC